MTRTEALANCTKLSACIDDPQWAGHAEVSKNLLREVLKTIRVQDKLLCDMVEYFGKGETK